MNFLQLAKLIPGILDSGVSLEIKSQPGLGKSEFVDQTVQRMSQRDAQPWGFAKLFLATQTPVDLLGYMVPEHRAGKLYSSFTEPLWMQTVDGRHVSEFKRGVLFLDEYGQAEGDVKRASAELLLNGGLGPHRLPKGWSVVAASNRASDRSGVTKSFDFVINRRAEIEIEPDLASWEDWAVRSGVHPIFTTFAVQNPEVVFSEGVPDKQGPWCTPRSLLMLERVFRSLSGEEGVPVFTDKEGKSNPEVMEVASGIIGAGAATQLVATIMLAQEMPKLSEIITSPGKAKLPTRPDAQMLVCYQLAHRATEENIDPLIQYIERLPEEFTVTFGKSACKRDPDLVNTKAFGGWCQRNASLMMAIVDAR
jgi:hypothetical protein